MTGVPGALRLLGQGREAEIFEWSQGRALRLMRSPDAGPLVEAQAAAMRAAWAAGAPVPAVYERVEVGGRPGLVMDRIDGPDLLTLLGRRPWSLFWAARTLGVIHAGLHEIVAPPELPELRASLRQRIEAAPVIPPSLRRFAVEIFNGLPNGDRVCHGDFHPGNLLVGEKGPTVIDWTLAARGDPAGDVARQQLIIRVGELPPGTSRVVRVAERFGRGVFLRAYVRTYRRRRRIDEEMVARWQIAHAAARFAEGIEGEFPALIRFLESRAVQ